MIGRRDMEMRVEILPEQKEKLVKLAQEFGQSMGTGKIIALPDSMLGPSDSLKHIDTVILLRILTERLAKNGWEIQVTQSITQQPEQPKIPCKQFESVLALKQNGLLTHEEYSKKLEEIGTIFFDAESWIYERTAAYPMVLSRISSNSSLGKNFVYEPYIMTAKDETAIRHGDILIFNDGFWSIAGANP